MRKERVVKKTVIGMVAALMLALIVVSPVQANESRSQSLLYNLSFEDQTDVFLFPNLLINYPGIYFHMPANIANVYGGLILDMDDAALGVFIRRPMAQAFDQFRMGVLDIPLQLPGMITLNAGAAIEPHVPGQIFDLMYGTKSWGFGLRLHMFSEISTQNGLIAGADTLPANGSFNADVNGGFAISKGMNLRTNLSFTTVKDNYILIVGRVGMRYMDPRIKRTRLVVAGELEFGFLSPDADGVDASFGLAIPFKGGVRMALVPDSMYLGLLGGIDLQVLQIQDDDMRLGIALPTLEMGFEWYALSWLHLRTAIKGAFGILLAHPGDNNPQSEQMVFSSGAGILLGPITIDGVIQYRLWQNGPYLISGVPGIFTGVTVSFHWGEGGQAAASESSGSWGAEESKPAPAPAPKAKPAPAPQPPPPEKKPAETKPAEEEKKDSGFEGWQE